VVRPTRRDRLRVRRGGRRSLTLTLQGGRLAAPRYNSGGIVLQRRPV
jgi:hypothetical protein